MPGNRFSLSLFNPSDYPRSGHVTIDWPQLQERTHLDPGRLVIHDPRGNVLPCQIDSVFPGKAKLSFTLAEELPSVSRDDYHRDYPASCVFLGSGDPRGQERPETKAEVIEGTERDEVGRLKGVKLRNSLLDVWINLVPAPWEEQRNWFSGSATAVVLPARGGDAKEFLDGNYWEHDPEKRILQLDRLRLSCPAWDSRTHQDVPVFNQPYELFSQSAGPVRATVTLASAPFEYTYPTLGRSGEQKLTCRLFRVLSLYRDADSIAEELFVRGSPDGNLEGEGAVDLNFIASYFAYMRMRGGLRISRFEHIPDWFAVTSGQFAVEGKFHSYGFATDVHSGPVAHPSPGQLGETAMNTFAWSLYPSKNAKCLHLFTFWRPEDSHWLEGADFWDNEGEMAKVAQRECESRAGKAWYELIFKPLTAAL